MNTSAPTIASDHGLRISAETAADDVAAYATVLLIDREQESGTGYAAALEKSGCVVIHSRTVHSVDSHTQQYAPDLIVYRRYDQNEPALPAGQHIPQIVIVDAGSPLPMSACEVEEPFFSFNAPVSDRLLQTAVRRAIDFAALQTENQRQLRQLAFQSSREIVGHSPAAVRLREQIQQLAESGPAVLIQGESGTGKQATARAIHDGSGRAHRPFLILDCSLLTAACLERELYGEHGGSMFDAGGGSPGCLDRAAGGTCLLLNIDEMALMLQTNFARVIKEGRYGRLGAQDYRPLDAQLIVTTSYDLSLQSRQGLFCPELYDAISGARLTVPPLRDRCEDIAPLTEHFLRNISLKHGQPAKRISNSSMEMLTRYHWPGNIRELENLLQRACAIDGGPMLTCEMIRPWFLSPLTTEATVSGMTLREMERKLIESVFAQCAGNRDKTAQALGIGIRTLSGKLREYGYPPRGGPGSNRSGNRAA